MVTDETDTYMYSQNLGVLYIAYNVKLGETITCTLVSTILCKKFCCIFCLCQKV